MERSNLITRREVKQALRKFARGGGIVAKLPAERNGKRQTVKASASAETAAYLANHFGIYLSTFQGS